MWRLSGSFNIYSFCNSYLFIVETPPALPPMDWLADANPWGATIAWTTIQSSEFSLDNGCIVVAPKTITLGSRPGFADWAVIMCQDNQGDAWFNYIYTYIGQGFKPAYASFTLNLRICPWGDT